MSGRVPQKKRNLAVYRRLMAVAIGERAMQIITEFPCDVVETPDMEIVLSDGCRLSARVWMPKDAGAAPVPAVLEYIPYRKRDGTLPRDEMMHPYVAGHGYACVRVDMRGNGDSDGLMTDEYTIQELADACEVIEWLAAQPWCSGSVGMMGKSWGGFNCLQTAFLQPPALKAVISVCSTTDRFADDIAGKVPDKATAVILCCASGGRSGMACDYMQQMGYQQVSNGGSAGAVSMQCGLPIDCL